MVVKIVDLGIDEVDTRAGNGESTIMKLDSPGHVKSPGPSGHTPVSEDSI